MLRSSKNALDWSLAKWTCKILNLKSPQSHSCLARLRNELTSFKKKKKSYPTFSWGAVGPEQLDVLHWSTLLLSAGPIINGRTHRGLHIRYCSLNRKKSVWLLVDKRKAIMSCWRRQTQVHLKPPAVIHLSEISRAWFGKWENIEIWIIQTLFFLHLLSVSSLLVTK